MAALYGRSLPLRRVWSSQWRDAVEATMDVCAADPELLVVGSDVDLEQLRAMLPEIDRRFPGTSVVVLVAERSDDRALDLLRLGARDVLVQSTAKDQFKADLDRLIDTTRARRQSTAQVSASLRRRVITVLSPKGGSGKTTLATNVAVALAHRLPNRVLLLDLDTQFGDCAAALGLEPQHSLVDAIAALSHDRSALKVFLTSHRSGLAVLSPPDDLAAVEDIEPDDLKRLVSALAEEFPLVVIDTASGIDGAGLAAMELATDFLFVSTTDVPAIRALRRQVEALDQVGYVSPRRTFVLNRANAKVGLSASDVAAAVGMAIDFEVPSTRLIPLSTNEGEPVAERDRGGVARRFDEIAEYFAPRQENPSRWGLLDRLKER